jgi:hypothetical protein
MPLQRHGESFESARIPAPMNTVLLNLAHDCGRDAGPFGQLLLAETENSDAGIDFPRDRRPVLGHVVHLRAPPDSQR